MQHAPEFEALVEAVRPGVKEVPLEGVLADVRSGRPLPYQLIDVREDHEWEAGHLPGATHLGRGIIERDITGRFPNKATPLVLYCGGGFRSVLSADNLRKMGYTEVASMEGGVRGWKAAGGPVVTP